MAAPEGQEVASKSCKSHFCAKCLKTEQCEKPFPRCSGCQLVRYCSRKCQKQHWGEHKVLCKSVREFKVDNNAQRNPDNGTYVSHLTPAEYSKVVGLVGKRCMVHCQLNGQKVHALWDTGAQVSLISKKWLDEHLPDLPLRNIESLLDDGTELDLKTANGSCMPYEGFVVVQFKLETSTVDQTIMVPMLVTHETLDYPIIGYNVIEELVKKEEVPDQIATKWAASFPDIRCEKIQSLVNFIQAPSTEQLCFVKTIKQDVVIPQKTTVSVKCRANTGPVEKRIPVLFEPNSEQSWPSGLEISEELLTIPHGSSCRLQINVLNTSDHDITLYKRTTLGTLQLVKSVKPQEVRRRNVDSCESEAVNSVYSETRKNSTIPPARQEDIQASNSAENEDRGYNPIDDLDLSGLTKQQQMRVRQMLEEEKGTFSTSDDDIGCVEELELKLNMRDQIPVQKTYNSVPRPLYPEVKQHIEDLLNRGWITKSRSPYSSPVVCVRKKNGELRLCVDYRELNKRTVPDRHPLPRVQDTIDGLGGNK